MPTSPNFGFLAVHDPLLDLLGGQAERLFALDPAACLAKLRLFGEALARLTTASAGLSVVPGEDQLARLNRLWDEGVLRDTEAARLFHDLRRAGNAAAHENRGDHREALHQLKMARTLGVWFHRTFGSSAKFAPGPFVPPEAPKQRDEALAGELEALRRELELSKSAAAAARRVAEEEARLRAEAEARAHAQAGEVEAALALAQETEARLARATTEHERLLAKAAEEAASRPAAETEALLLRARDADKALDLDEASTRRLIDAQLRAAGWEVDSETLTFARGARPQKGRNLAIAEWPTKNGPADYVLFLGLMPIAVVEAKRGRRDVPASIEQAKRYSRGYAAKGDEALPPEGPWRDYVIPFLFATNGRPYLKQLETKSGIWFLDARRPQNHPRALVGWYTPSGLGDLFQQDEGDAHRKLKEEPTDYLGLRDYQLQGIAAVEAAIEKGERRCLLAMATGTGKTRTCVGLAYRLLKTERFRRVLFLVDRRALGDQAADAFKNTKLESLLSFTDIFEVKELADITPDPSTKLHVATVQGMAKRILEPTNEDEVPPVDRYDCVVVDECHRGYNLDREMTDAELTFRSEEDYFSTYRRVLDHFDAVKIGLTATPAPHTLDIFGEPVFYYSYRQAVVDGYLVDHEPPIRIVTKLAEDGITWHAGEEILVLDSRRQQLDLFKTPDDVNVNIEEFNTRVLTENFNRVVCRTLAQHLDPSLPGKTLIFCVTDSHADLVVKLLKEALDEKYGAVDDDAVQKITGAADRPSEKIRHYKNERLPSIAVTVDLLTTGIDVPAITSIVFLRRIRSRILYDQMVGRATRRCDAIKKERFLIFDAVDLYSALQQYSDMKPVVTNPSITFAQLVEELGAVKGEEARREVLDQLVAKLQRKKRALPDARREDLVTLAGETPDGLIAALRRGTPGDAAAWFAAHPNVAAFLDEVAGESPTQLVSTHEDELRRTERGYGQANKPDDYLEGFRKYLAANMDRLPALVVVAQRPRDLTRQQLRELRLELDRAGYSEMALKTAWREKTNADVAASIVGFIRRELRDSPLLAFEERVDRALKRILSRQAWTEPQRLWLERIAKQIKKETVVDRQALDVGEFKAQAGGYARLNKVFDGKLAELLADIQDTIWTDAAA